MRLFLFVTAFREAAAAESAFHPAKLPFPADFSPAPADGEQFPPAFLCPQCRPDLPGNVSSLPYPLSGYHMIRAASPSSRGYLQARLPDAIPPSAPGVPTAGPVSYTHLAVKRLNDAWDGDLR